ncbi:Transcriptional regulator [Lunatimonas lonarensis]|uniref:Transcriptional regulator n=1 Tax=Lunatimonas lonarensis TaxID=1232681 RepID=R7ZRM3_9BACT|nr:Tm-1-like ATP-binding domain-containing protein [Lunatimonas lonarensis]EON76629.1 Transcriptional regulator [Lunatimonas lonarensis]
MKSTNTGFLVVLGCFDTKWEVYGQLYRSLVESGASPKMVNLGLAESGGDFPVDVESSEIAALSGYTIGELRNRGDRGFALDQMAMGAQKWLSEHHASGLVKGVIGMGGGGGTFLFLKAIQVLPLGLPKMCISTLATKDVSLSVGVKDVVLVPSVVDVAGLNRIIRPIIHQAAAALLAMSRVSIPESAPSKPLVAISMFGNTTECVNRCTALLEENGFEVMAFHANGVGGRNMEALIKEGVFNAVMDLTTTELADEFCGGILSAGPDRMKAAVLQQLPLVVAPGCLDMVNFGRPETVPAELRDRTFYQWAPDVTLMRTNKEDNHRLGEHIASLVNPLKSRVAIVWPEGGFSQVGSKGGLFFDPEADSACLDGLLAGLDPSISVKRVPDSINSPSFAEAAVAQLLRLVNGK